MYEYSGNYAIRKVDKGFQIVDSKTGKQVPGTTIYSDLQSAKAALTKLKGG
jgi:hypothetical protein